MHEASSRGRRIWLRRFVWLAAALCLTFARATSQAVISETRIHVVVQNDEGVELPNQRVKLIPESTAPHNLALPAPGVEKDQTDHDADPSQGITPPQGPLVLTGSPQDLGLPPEAAGSEYSLTLPRNEQTSRNFFMGGVPIGTFFAVFPRPLNDYLVSLEPVGANLTATLTYPVELDRQIRDAVGGVDGVQGQEENTCKDKLPALHPSTWPTETDVADLPGATLPLAEGTP